MKPMKKTLTRPLSLDQLDAVNRPIATAGGMPNAAYIEQNFHRFERDHVFGATWSALAFCDDHRDEGTVTPVDFMGLPLLIVRRRDGGLAVFHNVCSHRGTRLVEETKKTNGLLVCPYHAWTYDLSGALKSTPHIGGEGTHEVEGFSREKHGLKPVRSHCWMGVLFINLDGHAAEFSEYAAPLTDRYRRYFGTDGAASLIPSGSDRGLSLEVNCNWKLAMENYCEAYHLPWIHPSLNAYSPLARHYCMIISDDFSGQGTDTFTPTIDGGANLPVFADWPEDKREVAEYPAFYPNLLLGFQVNHVFALIVHPLSAGRIREDIRLFYVGEGATADCHLRGRQSNLAAWQRVFREDIESVERMQRGRHSSGFDGGVFSAAMDGPNHHFHQWVARKYCAAYTAAG